MKKVGDSYMFKRKNLENAIAMSLMVTGLTGGNALAWEWGLNNNNQVLVISDAEKSYTVNSTADKSFGIINQSSGSLTVNDVIIDVKSSANEVFGVYNIGGSAFVGKNVNIKAVSSAPNNAVYGLIANSGNFTAGNLTMDISNLGSEAYGIQNIGGTNTKTGNIKITGDSNSNFIGITNKWGNNTFSAENIYIEGQSKGYMVGIENLNAYQMGMKDITVKLTKKENGGGHAGAGMVAVSNSSIDFKADNTTLILDNAHGNDKTTGINVGGNKAIINGDLNIDIVGNASADVIGVKGEAQVAGDVKAELSGGKNVTGILGTSAIDGSVNMKINSLGSAFGINADQVTVGHDVNMDISGQSGVATGIASNDAIIMSGNLNINIHDTNASNRMAAVIGNTNSATHITIGGLQNNINVEGSSDFAEGLFSGVKLADNSVTNIVLKNTKDTYWQTHGIYDRDDKGFDLGTNAVLNVDVEANGLQSGSTASSEGVFGLLLTNVNGTESSAKVGSQINVAVQGAAVNDAGLIGTVGISGSIKADGDVRVDVKSEKGIGLRANSVGDHSEYTGEVIVKTNNGTAVGAVGYSGSYDASIKIDPVTGKKVQLLGDVKHFTKYGTQGALIDISLKTADSFLTGASIGANGINRITNLSFDNASVWNMTGDSVVNALINNDNAVIDLTQGADTLNVTDYSGTGGNFVMDTDLASESNGDKINIISATTGTAYIQVKDSSLLSGIEVTGNKSLLLITDASEKATFTGKHLNAGGLWDVTPTIENGTDVTKADGSTGSKKEWYLTKIEKVINNDTGVLLSAMDNSYALWRNTNDSLRKRLGDLRFRDNTVDGDGIWARYSGGKFAGSGFDSSYNMYQLGYDKADNAKSTYGFAIDSGNANARYSTGSGKDKLFAGSLYGTWYGENGSYTDVVARVGQFDTDIRSYGDYQDKAKAKSHAYSMSVEYGKTIELNKAHGTFIEPQAQLIVGRLGSSSYTTDRGTQVNIDGMNSYIARFGFVAGQKTKDGNDVYVKASALHEFGGKGNVDMQAANGETLSMSKDYGDTWFEIGIGTNINLSKTSHFYGDIERSFGADIQKKWQINAGVRFEF